MSSLQDTVKVLCSPAVSVSCFFELRGGHMHKDPVAQELSSASDSRMSKKVRTTRGSNHKRNNYKGSTTGLPKAKAVAQT